jgi:hypothetical protein
MEQAIPKASANQSQTRFLSNACVFGNKGRIKEGLARSLESDAMFCSIVDSFLSVPSKYLASIVKQNVHSPCIYFAYADGKVKFAPGSMGIA